MKSEHRGYECQDCKKLDAIEKRILEVENIIKKIKQESDGWVHK